MTIPLPSSSSPVGSPVSTPAALGPPSPLLADNIDPSTGDFASLFVGIDPIDAQVINAVKIVRGSGASVTEDGMRLADIRKIKDDTQDDIKGQVRRALSRLIQNQDIRFLGTSFDYLEKGSQFIQIRVQWVNLRSFDRTPKENTIPYPPRGE